MEGAFDLKPRYDSKNYNVLEPTTPGQRHQRPCRQHISVTLPRVCRRRRLLFTDGIAAASCACWFVGRGAPSIICRYFDVLLLLFLFSLLVVYCGHPELTDCDAIVAAAPSLPDSVHPEIKKVTRLKLVVVHQLHVVGSHDAVGFDGCDELENQVVLPPFPVQNPDRQAAFLGRPHLLRGGHQALERSLLELILGQQEAVLLTVNVAVGDALLQNANRVVVSSCHRQQRQSVASSWRHHAWLTALFVDDARGDTRALAHAGVGPTAATAIGDHGRVRFLRFRCISHPRDAVRFTLQLPHDSLDPRLRQQLLFIAFAFPNPHLLVFLPSLAPFLLPPPLPLTHDSPLPVRTESRKEGRNRTKSVESKLARRKR
ncbi:hypothetical protein MUK42_37121, partial [Musa troglodytarum]